MPLFVISFCVWLWGHRASKRRRAAQQAIEVAQMQAWRDKPVRPPQEDWARFN